MGDSPTFYPSSPVLVDDSADVHLVAQSIVVAKTANAGQICVSADYVREWNEKEKEGEIQIITTPEKKEEVVEAIRHAFDKLGNMVDVKTFARIVNERHFA